MKSLVYYFSPIHYSYRKQRMQHLLGSVDQTTDIPVFVNPPPPQRPKAGSTLFRHEEFDILTLPDLGADPLLGLPWHDDGFHHYADLLKSITRIYTATYPEIDRVIALHGHPSWCSLVPHLPEWIHLYDRLDRFDKFPNAEHLGIQDSWAMEVCDGVLYTSDQLAPPRSLASKSRRIANAVKRSFFELDDVSSSGALTERRRDLSDATSPLVLGYVGAIDEWFDFDLVRELASSQPQIKIRIAGGFAEAVAGEQHNLRGIANIELLGEIPHDAVASFYHSIDLQIIPFVKSELTDAVDAVKVYEAASCGVFSYSTDLDGMSVFPSFVASTSPREHWIERLAFCDEWLQAGFEEDRILWARNQTWDRRVDEIFDFVNFLAKGSAIGHAIVGYGASEKIKETLRTLVHTTRTSPIVVVDNGIVNGEEFREWCSDFDGRITVITPGENLGYAGGANYGIKFLLDGESVLDFIAVHNDDLLFSIGWEIAMLRAFEGSEHCAAVTPSSCGVGSENRVPCESASHDEVPSYPNPFSLRGASRPRFQEIRFPGFFSVMFRREALSNVGLFDESFGLGYYEDDDWSERARKAGWRVGFAGGAFVHHVESSSFGALDRGDVDTIRGLARGKFFQKHEIELERVPHDPADFV